MRKKLVSAMAALLCLVLLVGLAFRPAPSTLAEETEGEKMVTEYPLTITDTAGREVVLEAEPQKIVSLGPNMTELVFALEAGDRLVGRTTYCDYPEEALEVPEIGTLQEPNFELITEIAPDLVLASTHVSDDTLAKLDELKIPVLMLYDSEHLSGLRDIIQNLGLTLNLQEKANQLSTEIFDRIYNAKDLPVVYYVVGFGESGDYTAGGNTFINDIIEAAGGKNAAHDLQGWQFSQEKLVEADPDIIIIPSWAEESFGQEAPYSELSAVKNGQVFAVDNNIFDRQGPRNAEAVEVLAQIIEDFQATQEAETDKAA